MNANMKEIRDTLSEVETFLAELASSSMLSGEDFPERDKGAFYSAACRAKNKVMWIIGELSSGNTGSAREREVPSEGRILHRTIQPNSAVVGDHRATVQTSDAIPAQSGETPKGSVYCLTCDDIHEPGDPHTPIGCRGRRQC
jgi:hypothetical protein